MYTIFNLLERFGHSSALFNWREHLAGWTEFVDKNGMLSPIRNETSATLFSPECISRMLEVDIIGLEQEQKTIECLDPISGEILRVVFCDFSVYTLDLEKFSDWVKKLLFPKNQVKSKIDKKALFFYYSIYNVDIYVILPQQGGDIRSLICGLSSETKTIIFYCSESFYNSQVNQEILESKPNITALAISEFIAFKIESERYEYRYGMPFIDFLSGFYRKVAASFLERPDGATWADLEIVIVAPNRHKDTVSDEHIIATYGAMGIIFKPLTEIKDLKGIGQLKSDAFKLLCELASTKGLLEIGKEFTSKKISRLRDKLQSMFGYREDEDPLPNKDNNSSTIKAAFNIRFSDGNSDPLLRRAALKAYIDEIHSPR